MSHFARAVGLARRGQPEEAEVEVEALASLQKTLADAKNLYWARQVGIERMMASGWLARALGHPDEAVSLMQDAAQTEESLETHDTLSPGPVGMTAHEALGYLLLELRRPADAFKTFEASLRVSTNRLQSYAGAANAAASVGDLANARFYYGNLPSSRQAPTMRAPRSRKPKLSSKVASEGIAMTSPRRKVSRRAPRWGPPACAGNHGADMIRANTPSNRAFDLAEGRALLRGTPPTLTM